MSRFLDELSVTPLADGIQWRINEHFRYESDLMLGAQLLIPARFVTDFASVPQSLWAEFPPWQRYGAAAVVHDWLYWAQIGTRDAADLILREAMTVLGVPILPIDAIYAAVRLGGSGAWTHNAQLKASGYTRQASPASNPPYAAL